MSDGGYCHYCHKRDCVCLVLRALEIAKKYGTIDGSHHKQWVIDQMVRVLQGTDRGYKEFLTENPDWDAGVAP